MPPLQSISREWKSGTPAPGWREVLRQEFAQEYMKSLVRFLDEERVHHTIFPEPANIFRAYSMMDYDDVSVVILGQDPYHGPGQAHGLCFSVLPGVPAPPSLNNIFIELERDLGVSRPDHGCLTPWARQGVLLLNSVLTVAAGRAGSHQGRGWEGFTDAIVDHLNREREHLVFLLWGSPAQAKGRIVDRRRHGVLTAPHPSPLSAHRGFFGCGHFSAANRYLLEHGRAPIDWQLPPRSLLD